ncbi:MAG: hypothetical protein D6702_07235 [Planctomycetota bacterium]|nr:MAG: hypothetical protein D6702_07235 [Planctomycetota bacterium]
MAARHRRGDDGRPPPARKPFLLRLPPDLLAELRAWAAHDLRSLNAHIEFLLREAVRRRRQTPRD